MNTLILSLALLMAGSAVASATIANEPRLGPTHTVYRCPAPSVPGNWCPPILELSAPLP
jgi:hypothetical protein